MEMGDPTPHISQNANYNLEELQRRASKDDLSGLFNRATLEQLIKKRLELTGPGDSCALFIIDLDDFKNVNDTLGHRAGDQAIRQCGQVLAGLFRASDIVGRLGGDEFAVFISGDVTDKQVCQKAAAICASLQMSLGDGPAVVLTASVGVYISSGGQHFDGMYQSADLALYKAKKAGKHRYCVKSSGEYPSPVINDPLPVNTIPLSGLLEYLGSGVALLELGSKPQLIYTSPSFYNMLSTERKPFSLPLPLDSFVCPDDLASLETTLREGASSGAAVEHIHRVDFSGADWLWWHIKAVKVNYDNPNPVMLITATDITPFKKEEQQLKLENQWLQAAFEQTSQLMWEVDILSMTFIVYRTGVSGQGDYGTPLDFPDGLIKNGWIHPDSASRFRVFAADLLGGQSHGYGSFMLQNRDNGSYGWASLSYKTLYDEAGRPISAVGVKSELPKGLYSQSSGALIRRPLPDGLISDLMAQMRANLTQDTVDELWIEGSDFTNQVQLTSCSLLLEHAAGKLPQAEIRESFRACFDRDTLLEQYRQGRRWHSAEYRFANKSGNILWIRHALNVTEDPETHDVYLYIYMIRTDLRRQWEQSFSGEVKSHLLYESDTMASMTNALLQRNSPGSRAVAVLTVEGIPSFKDNGGAEISERLRHDIAVSLAVALGGSCFMGRGDSGRLVMVFPAVTTRASLRNRLEEALAFVRMTLTGLRWLSSLRFIVGIAVHSGNETEYEALLSQASGVCDLWWNAVSDMVVFSHNDDELDLDSFGPDQIQEQVRVHSAELRRPLSESEKDVAFSCVSSMLSADSLENSIGGVLQTIGGYYEADRVYILMLSDNEQMVTMPYEWTAPGKRSIQLSVSGRRLDRFPLMEKCLKEKAPFFLTRTKPLDPRASAPLDQPWYFTVCPLIEKGRVTGFLCIENSRAHPADAALFGVLIPYMLRERDRFRVDERQDIAVDRLMNLPGPRSYMETVLTLNSDVYNSMGVVCLDIPGIASMNVSLGFEYVSKFLRYISKNIVDIFGPKLVFRTWEAEFVAFCPNLTNQVFQGRCSRLNSIIQRRYPKETRIGTAWAEGTFTGRQLVERARSNMRSNRSWPSMISSYGGKMPSQSFEGPVSEQRFKVYFQPKVDIRSGALIGAEALVRGVDEKGNVIAPGDFISFLEDRGGIKDLDMFVLDKSLEQMDKWRKQGLGIVPTSVNLSRVTLFHPSTMASILAIQSRYPHLPSQALELEITESVGGIDSSDLKRVVDNFRSCGLRLSLDDFGSQYANMSMFTNVKFDVVKLDRSLISELTTNLISRMLIKDIVQICAASGMDCVAEGVEVQEQAQALMELGCTHAQGFFYGKPMPAEQFEQTFLSVPQGGRHIIGKEDHK